MDNWKNTSMGILDLLESKPSFLKEFWEIPPFPGEPNCHNHRISYLLPAHVSKKKRLRYSSGFGTSAKRAIIGCLGEAIERYSGYKVDLRKIKVAAWKDLKHEAIHPSSIAGYSTSQFREPNFPYRPFTEQTKIGWIKGFSVYDRREIWVPSQLTFLSAVVKNEAPILPRISSGLACGSSWEMAVLHAIYELVERDSFMIMWLHRLSLPLVDCKQILIKRFERPHLKYHVIQTTSDLQIPTYIAMIIQEQGWPYLVLGAGSGLNALEAIEKALTEAVTSRTVLLYRRKVAENFTKNQTIKQAFKKVSEIHEHGMLYTDSRFFSYAGFLKDSTKRISLKKLPGTKSNIKRNLDTCLNILKSKGFEVIAVDITPPEIKKRGLTSVKVIIPGLQPLHFGWHFEYLKNPRLYEAPVAMGYKKRPITEREIYRIPHPLM